MHESAKSRCASFPQSRMQLCLAAHACKAHTAAARARMRMHAQDTEPCHKPTHENAEAAKAMGTASATTSAGTPAGGAQGGGSGALPRHGGR